MIFVLLFGVLLTHEWKTYAEETTKDSETGAQFLHNVINQLQNDRTQNVDDTVVMVDRQTESSKVSDSKYRNEMKIMGPTPVPSHDNLNDVLASSGSAIKENAAIPPPPSLSKEELLALYQAAINKGATLDLASLFGGSTTNDLQAVQNLFTSHQNSVSNMNDLSSSGTIPGYYYYFYPIQSFQKDSSAFINKDQEMQAASSSASTEQKKPAGGEMIPTAMMVVDTGEGNKRVEPLFVAMASFIGMALMFIFSILFLPKFGTLRSRGISALKHAPDEFAGLTRLVLEAIDGKDCSERVICEVARAVRKMRLDKKPIRLVEILLAPRFENELQQLRKAIAKKEKCNLISCKLKKTK